MSYFKYLLCLSVLTFHGLFAVEEQLGSAEATLNSQVQITREMTIPGLDFGKLAQTETKSPLSSFVQETESSVKSLRGFNRIVRNAVVVAPYTQGKVIVNGILCHVANYARCSLVTVLDGPFFGTQTTISPAGVVLIVNNVCYLDETPYGLIIRHEYADCTVLTGLDQVIIFH